MRTLFLYVLAGLGAFAQLQTPAMIYNSGGSATGAWRLQERRTFGTDYFGLQAPDNIPASFTLTGPSALPAADGMCAKFNTAGVWSFGTCGGPSETYLVTNYGAVCDGTTDDAAAFQDAVDAAQSAGGGTIVLPYGTCAIGSKIDVTNNFIGFRGQGRSMSVLLGTHNGTLVNVITTSGDIYAFEMSDMTLQPNGGTASAAVIVDGANDFMRSAFHNLYIANGRRGLWIKNAGFADWLHFRDNICDMTLVTTGTCLDIETGLTSPGGIIANNQFIQGSGGTAIYYHGDFGDIVITGNHSESGAYFLNADCDSGGSPACTYGERLTVTGNKIDNATQPIRIDTVQNSRITGNVVLGGIAEPVQVVGTSNGLEIDDDYNQGKRYISAAGSTAISPAKVKLGDHTIDAANTTVGLSVVDTGASSAIGIGQSLANSMGLSWVYNSTPSNAYGLLYTFGATNSMKYIAAFHKFTGDIYPETHDTYINGTTSLRWASMATTDFNAGGGAGTITFSPSASPTPTVGMCWMAATTGGEGMWDTCGGGGWTVSGSDVYRASGSVGIGVTAPAAALHMSATNVAIFMDGYSNVAPNILMRQSNGSAGSETATVSGDRIGQVAMAGYGTGRVTAARIGAYAGSNFTGSNAETYLRFETTASGSTTVTERWRIQAAGNLVPSATATYNIGASGTEVLGVYAGSAVITSIIEPKTNGGAQNGDSLKRWSATYTEDLNANGPVTFSSSTITASSTFSSDLIPTTSNVYILGSSSAYWNQIRGETFFVENSGRIRPTTTNTGSVGLSSARFSDAFFQNLNVSSSVTAPSGSTGTTTTLTCGAGQAVKNITISGGIVTSASCGTP